MKKNSSALYSGYIIDGAKMDQTPARMLNECMTPGAEQYPDCCPGQTGDMIIDESTDPVPGSCRPDSLLIPEYMKQLSVLRTSFRRFKAGDPAFLTRLRIASAIIDSIWSEGHFRLDNLRLSLGWQWDGKAIGSMAAFYASAEAAAGYIYDLGAALEEYSYTEIQEEETEPAGNILNVSVTGTDSGRTHTFTINSTNVVYTYDESVMLEGDEVTGALSRVKGETYGNYAYLPGSLSAPEYYELVIAPDSPLFFIDWNIKIHSINSIILGQ